MKNCTNCGHELEDIARFCEECGAKQEEPKKICSTCGKELPGRAKFCSGCGTALNDKPAIPQKSVTDTTKKTENKAQTSMISDDVEVSQPDENTLTINIKGVPFNLKLVMGEDYGTVDEIPDFFMGETPVTQGLWMTVMGNNPSEINDNLDYPVTNINNESLANSFLIKLQKLTGIKFDLPTQRQWYYAAEGGHKSRCYEYYGSDNISEVSWDDDELHPVKELLPNELGLYDMGGIVAERLKETSHANPREASYRGFRMVVNLPATIRDKNQPLGYALNNVSLCMEENRARAKKEMMEIETELKNEIVKKYGKDKGIIVYEYADYAKIKKTFHLFAGEGYLKTLEEERELSNLEEKVTQWKDFGEYGRDEEKPSGAYEKGDCKYAILGKDTLIIKRERYSSLPDMPFILNTINMKDNFWKMNKEISNNQQNITKLKIDDKILIIGEGCFNGFWNIKIIDMPKDLYEIKAKSFAGCNSLEYVTLKQDLQRIRENAFENTGLKAILIPKDALSIGKGAFGNTDLSVVFVPTYCKIDEGAFDGCKKLTK